MEPARVSGLQRIAQAKLTVGGVDDPAEREADDIADLVLSVARSSGPTGTGDSRLRRRTSSLSPASVRRRASIGREGGDLDADTERELQSARSGGVELDAGLQRHFGEATGADVSGVRLHAGAQSASLNDQMGAEAFALGNDIFFRDGIPDTGSDAGLGLVAHEVAHTVQQGASPVSRSVHRQATAMSQRIRRKGIVFNGQESEQGSITNLKQLRDGIEDLLDQIFIGVRALFEAGGVVTSVEGWGELLFGLLSEDNDMGTLTKDDCAEIVENIKAENRKEQFLHISEFYGYFEDSYPRPIWTLDAFKDELISHHINVDDDGKDDATLQALIDARGDRDSLQDDPDHTFLFGTESADLDTQGLKDKLDEELGTEVNWGHEISDCLNDSGKKGEMYYYRTGVGLTQVGTTSQSHASSKGGRTIIWENSGGSTEILAVGKHTNRADTRLSKGASYEIVKTFSDTYAGYTGKIIGFKAS